MYYRCYLLLVSGIVFQSTYGMHRTFQLFSNQQLLKTLRHFKTISKSKVFKGGAIATSSIFALKANVASNNTSHHDKFNEASNFAIKNFAQGGTAYALKQEISKIVVSIVDGKPGPIKPSDKAYKEYCAKRDTIKELISTLVDPNITIEINYRDVIKDNNWDYKYSLLHFIVLFNDYELAELLIKKGANVNSQGFAHIAYDWYKETPIFFATTVKMAQLLQKHGAVLHSKENDRGKNLLHFVMRQGYSPDLVKFYLANGVPFEKDKRGNNPWHSLAKSCEQDIAESFKKAVYSANYVKLLSQPNNTLLSKTAEEIAFSKVDGNSSKEVYKNCISLSYLFKKLGQDI